jgi:predicted aspartyl protease
MTRFAAIRRLFVSGWRIAAAAFLLVPAIARADQPDLERCRLVQLASLDIDTQPDGTFTVPVSIDGHSMPMQIDTGSVNSSLSDETVRQFDFEKRNGGLPSGMFFNNIVMSQSTTVHAVGLGNLFSTREAKFAVVPEGMLPASVYGILGPDLMVNYDVEFDFYHGKFNVFRPHRCDDAVTLSWTDDNYAEMPMQLDAVGHITVSATLDGKPVQVIVDTGASTTFMNLDVARKVFGWSADDPSVKPLRVQRINNGRPVQFYSYPFAVLDLNGLQVKNPKIDLAPSANFSVRIQNGAQIILGLNVLRQLHMYVAYPQRALYLTPAEAGRKTESAQPASNTPAAAASQPTQSPAN